jgi:hypothetical protein
MDKHHIEFDEEKKDGSNHSTAIVSAPAAITKTAETKIADGNWVRF